MKYRRFLASSWPRIQRYAPVVGVVLVSIVAWYITYRQGLVLSYNDAMSHLDLGRLVVDSQQPGIAQLGSVWLPLNQLLYLPLIWVNWAWHSGFAGSFISMISYVLSVIGIYFIVMEITHKKIGAYLGALAFALNLNLLYLQSTPLTEPVFLLTLIYSLLFLTKYLRTNNTMFLILAALCTALQVAGRYDGWFIAGVETGIVVCHELFILKHSYKQTAGIVGLFLTPVVFTMALWFLWNAALYGNPLYSFDGPYSAHAQQAAIAHQTGLITQFNVWQSVRMFILAAGDNVGGIVGLLGLLGWSIYICLHTEKTWFRFALLILFMSAIAFNVIALFLGFSVLNVPESHWNVSHSLAGEYFNARYGITALPFIAVGYGLLVLKSKPIAAALAVLVVLQAGIMWHSGLITVKDGTIGSSSFVNQDIATALKQRVGRGQKVIASTSYFNAVMFRSGLDLNQFIYEGVSRDWKGAIARPVDYAQWIVIANGNVGDPVYNSLVLKEKSAFLASYALVYAGKHANLYERKTPFDMYITADGTKLMDGQNEFSIKGVNSYDLAYQSNRSIDATFRELHAAGVNTIRFWMFGDGNANGFQPSAGVLNEDRLKTTDYIFAEAHTYQIRLLPTLTNNWSDYGGMDQYRAWAGDTAAAHDDFYTNPVAVSLYKNYINHILTRRNTINGITYANDSAVAAWDIANEPRVDNPSDVGAEAAWINAIAQYTKSVDPNHLVTVSLDSTMLSTYESQFCSSPYIGFCSAHLYPQERNDPATVFTTSEQEDQQIASYKSVASSLHKPIVLSEIGIPKASSPFGQSAISVLNASLHTISVDHYSGWLVWNWAQTADNSYGFSPSGQDGVYTLGQLTQLVSHD